MKPWWHAQTAWRRLHTRRSDVLLCLLCSAVIAGCCLQVLLFGFGRDQSIYAEVARQALQGRVPYRDVWDFKPPGIFAVYALAQAALGNSMQAPRWLEVFGMLGSVAIYTRLSERVLGTRLAGFLGGTLATLLHTQLEFWHSGQPENFGGFLVVGALWACLEGATRAGVRPVPPVHAGVGRLAAAGVGEPSYWRTLGAWAPWSAACGALFGAAFLFKPPLVGGAVVCGSYLAAQCYERHEELRRGRRLGVALGTLAVGTLACLIPLGLCLGWFWQRGGLAALRWTFLEFTPGYTQLGWQGKHPLPLLYFAIVELWCEFSALAAVGGLVVLVLRPLHSREWALLSIVAGVLATQLVGVVMQAKFFQYHYAASLSLWGFVAGLGLYKWWCRWRVLSLGASACVAVWVLLASLKLGVVDLPGSFWERSVVRTAYALGLGSLGDREALDRELHYVADFNLDADRRVARYLREQGPADARLFVWGFEPLIYWLSEQPAASRFIYDVPQRAVWQRERARRLLLDDLRAHLPYWIVVQREDVFPSVTGDGLDSKQSLLEFSELEALVRQRYTLQVTIEDFEIYALDPSIEASR